MAVFLGNPGNQYRLTRHNAGWMVLDQPPFCDVSGWQKKFKGSWSQLRLDGRSVVLLKPETHMNKSGESVQAAARFFKTRPEEIIVVHDDVELTFGGCAIRAGGGLAGHNGLRSIVQHLSTQEFWRLRIGVGRPGRGDLHHHVLGRFNEEEEAELETLLSQAAARLVEALAGEPGH